MERLSSSPETPTGESFVSEILSQMTALTEHPDQELLKISLPEGLGYSEISVNPSLIYNISDQKPGIHSQILLVGEARRSETDNPHSVVAVFNATKDPLAQTMRIQPVIPYQTTP